MKPVLVISDTHYHNFTQYASITPNGVNTRLGDTIRATLEAAQELKRRGGRVIVHCGDVFHVRGSLAPSVLNPVVDLYKHLIKEGFEVHMISGNHDLETDAAKRLSSSVSALEAVGVKVYNDDYIAIIDDVAWRFIPWVKDMADLRMRLRGHTTDNLVIHAPLNGVIEGLPEHGLNPNDFNGLGFQRVFCGHYHNHKMFQTPDKKTYVFSVGALTHQNWGDTEATAGYMIVDDEGWIQVATKAPKFIKCHIDNLEDAINDGILADNYVKVVGGSFTDPTEIQEIKDDLLLKGAKAVVVEGLTRRPAATRGMMTTTAPTLASILGDYLDRTYPGNAAVKMEALDILNMVE